MRLPVARKAFSPSWSLPPNQPIKLSKGSVHLWQANLIDVSCKPSFVQSVVPLDEMEKLKSKSVMSQLTHAVLRDILCRYMAKRDGTDLIIQRGVHGKPYITSGPFLKFNVAHTDNVAVVAIADCEVGVDIERADRQVTNVQRLLRRLTPEEAQQVESAACPREALIKVWTRKEALLKCLGTGIKRGLSSFEVSIEPDSQWLVHIDGKTGAASEFSTLQHQVLLDDNDQGRSYLIACAYSGHCKNIENLLWRPE